MAYNLIQYSTIIKKKLEEKNFKVITVENTSPEGDYIAFLNTKNLMNDEHILAGKLMLGRSFNDAYQTVEDLSPAVYVERLEIRFAETGNSYVQYRNLLEAAKKVVGSENFDILNITVDTTGRGEVIFELPAPKKQVLQPYSFSEFWESAGKAAPEVI